MPRTSSRGRASDNLAEITLRMSKALSDLDARCRRDSAKAEEARDREILAGPGRAVLKRYLSGLEKARREHFQAVEDADVARVRDIRTAEDKRRREFLKQERKHRDARTKAETKRKGAVRKARAKWKASVRKAKELLLSKQRPAMRIADEILERELQDARERYQQAVDGARLLHRAAIQDDLVDERLAVEAANRKAERRVTAAAIDYERAVAHQEARMRSELSQHPEAQEVQIAYDRKLFQIRSACERDKEAVFKSFSRERRALRRTRRTKK